MGEKIIQNKTTSKTSLDGVLFYVVFLLQGVLDEILFLNCVSSYEFSYLLLNKKVKLICMLVSRCTPKKRE